MHAHEHPPEHAPVHTGTHARTYACTHSPCSAARGPEVQPPAAPIPWSKPVRMREKVMKARWALLRRESSGVAAVMKPQAEADSRMTFSPPILHGGREGSDGELCGWAAGRTRRPYRGGTRGGGRHRPSLGAALWGGHCSHIPSAEEAEAERAGYGLVPLSPWAPELPPWMPVAPQGTKHPRQAERRPQPTPAQPSGLPAPVLLWAGPPPIPFLGATTRGGITGPPGGHPPPESGSSPRRSC